VDLPKYRNGVTATFRGHPFDRVCKIHNIEHHALQNLIIIGRMVR